MREARRSSVTAFLPLLLPVLLLACGDAVPPAELPPPSPWVCEPYQIDGCACPDGARGVQECLEDGSAFAACACPTCSASPGRDDGCEGARCEPVRMAGARKPTALAIDKDHAFWIDQNVSRSRSRGRLMRVPLEGGAPITLAEGQVNPTDLVVADGDVYWVGNPLSNLRGAEATLVQRIPTGGGSPVTVDAVGGWGLVADARYVYWVGSTIRGLARSDGDLARPETIVEYSSLPITLASDGRSLYWLGVPGTFLLKGDPDTGEVEQLSSRTDPPPPTRDGLQGIGLAVDATHVYWLDGYDLGRVPVTGGGREVLATGQRGPSGVGHPGIVVSGDSLYWINRSSSLACADGTVMKMPRAGGTPQVVAAGQSSPAALAVDGESVYWVNFGHGDGDGAVMKTAK